MSSDTPVIEVERLGKRYEVYARPVDRLKQMLLPRLQRVVGKPPRSYFHEFWALRDVSLDVRRGETVGIIGTNGSGKSTLLQIICGTLHPTEGDVRTCGRIAALLELGAGFNPEFTGRENVFLSGLLYGMDEGVLRERYADIAAFADIGEFIEQPVKTYSSGMYVRLAFAIAAHVDADTLVIDEALSVGDVRFTQKCMRYLRAFQQHGTLLFVSHDTAAVTNLCSRAIWLDRGQLVADGRAAEVVERYLAVQHAADRAASGVRVHLPAGGVHGMDRLEQVPEEIPADVVDPRQRILNGDARRNLVEVFEFDPDHASGEFGAGTAHIVDVALLNASGEPHRLIQGGEISELRIEAQAAGALERPIFGFYVKDRLGQRLFGDNTYLLYRDVPLQLAAGERWCARFRFRMPVLPNGDYSIDVALASGTQDDHTQHHWIHDALVFRASEGTMRHGLIGIPMHEIRIERTDVTS